jgi:molybdopterin-guanine dinucleotide biosynthesis protein B
MGALAGDLGRCVPALGIAACSGVGKTSLLQRLIPLLNERGLRVGILKKTHHDIEIDRPGKDSHALRMAGARAVMLSAPRRRVLIVEREETRDPDLREELAHFDASEVDIILVEGYRQARFPKIELHRSGLEHPLLFPEDPSVIAVATDEALPIAPGLPCLDLNDPRQIADFILERMRDGKLER